MRLSSINRERYDIACVKCGAHANVMVLRGVRGMLRGWRLRCGECDADARGEFETHHSLLETVIVLAPFLVAILVFSQSEFDLPSPAYQLAVGAFFVVSLLVGFVASVAWIRSHIRRNAFG